MPQPRGSRRAAVDPPIPFRLRLPPLDDADADALRAGAVLDRMRLVDVDTAGRDLSETSLTECSIEGWRATGSVLRGAHLAETRIERLDAASIDASRSSWRDVEVAASRIGSADLSDADLRAVVVADTKIGHLNLRAARIRDLVVRDCVVDTIDLGDADVTRIRFEGSRVDALELARARLQHVDLRGLAPRSISPIESLAGATIDDDQLALIAQALAAHVGIQVVGSDGDATGAHRGR